MSVYLIGLIIPILSFFLVIWPRFIKVYFGVDPWHHLMVAEYIRRYKRLPVSFTNYIIPGPYGYPPFLFFILALFPKKFTDRYNSIFSPIFDSLHNYAIFVATIFLTHNLMIAVIAQIIAALTPVTVLEASILNARVLSYLFVEVSFFSLLLFSVNENILWLIFAGITLFTLFFTHKFGTQSFAFLAIVFSIVEKNSLYIVFFFMVWGLAFLFGGKRYKLIFNEQMDALKYWYKHRDNRFVHQFRGEMKEFKKRQFVDRMFVLSSKLPIASIVGEDPFTLLFMILLIVKYFNLFSLESVIPNHSLDQLILWATTMLVVGLLVLSIKRLRFIGEGYRYIEFAVFPMSIVLASYAPYVLKYYGMIFAPLFFLVCIIILVIIIFLQKKVILKDRNRSITKEKWEIINYINKNIGSKLRLGVFPLQEGDAFIYFTNGKVLTADSLLVLGKLNDIFPLVKGKIDGIIKKYKLNHIFFDKQYVTFKELGIKKYKILKEIDDFVLIKV